MQKIILFILSALILTTSAQAAKYTTKVKTQGIDVDAGSTTKVKYVDWDDGSKSKTGDDSIKLKLDGDWKFTWNDDKTVDFTGNIFFGDYRTQTNVTGTVTIDGRQTYRNANQKFTGTGDWKQGAKTLTFDFPTGSANSGKASKATRDSASCDNGSTSSFGKVCQTWEKTNPDYEGLQIEFIFSDDLSSFEGTLRGIEKSGSGLTKNTTKIDFDISGSKVFADPSPVPVPAAAWLFGSALVGLAGIGRKRA